MADKPSAFIRLMLEQSFFPNAYIDISEQWCNEMDITPKDFMFFTNRTFMTNIKQFMT